MKILILASNPRNDLDLDDEIRDLKEVIDSSRNRQDFEVEDALAVRAGDLQNLLFKHEPQIVHFCGHGGGQPGLVFEGKDGGEQWVRTEALRDLFRLFSNKVGCVLLNACYSEEQANEIVNHIDYVIGMNQAIRDDAAIAFAKGFYRALGYNCSIEEAYEFGCNAIQLEIAGDSTTRSGTTESVRKAELVNATASTITPDIPEHLKPVLKKRPQAGSSSRWREGTTTPPPLSPEKKEALQQEVVRAVTGFGANNRSASTPNPPIGITEPPQVLPEPPKATENPRRRFGPLILGGLVACLIPAISIYGYQKLQEQKQVQQEQQEQKQVQADLQQAIELAERADLGDAIKVLNQIPTNSAVALRIRYLLGEWSDRLLKRAEASYKNGNIDRALEDAQAIPLNSPIYGQAQDAIANWNKKQQLPASMLKAEQIILDQAIDYAKGEKWGEAIKHLDEIPANSAIATQSQGYLEAWSKLLWGRAEIYYDGGNIEDALGDAQAIPKNSPIHNNIQDDIVGWTKEKKIMDEIKKDLLVVSELSIKKSRRLLEQIKSSGLRQQAEDLIVELEKKLKDPQKVQIKPNSESGWNNYKYAWLSQRPVTPDDLIDKPDSELSIMRNSVYAKYGFIFGRDALKSEFLREAWYKPTRNESEVSKLQSDLERSNAGEILKFQKQKIK
jgi:YARHG domain